MEQGRGWILAPWHSGVAKVMLLAALFTHWSLGLFRVYQRRTLKIPLLEAAQIAFGIVVPPLLLDHIFSVYRINLAFGDEALYTRSILEFWILNPTAGLRQFLLFLAAWIHGCIGIHFWLRTRIWYYRTFPALVTILTLIPVLAFLGVTQAGRELSVLASDPSFIESLSATDLDTDAIREKLGLMSGLQYWMSGAIWLPLVLLIIVHVVREKRAKRDATITIRYPNGIDVPIPVGWTVLEASRHAGIPHASVCGGRARCSTCRVQIVEGMEQLDSPDPVEQRVLDRVNAGTGVRLACQLRPRHDIAIAPIVSPAIDTNSLVSHSHSHSGEEREITILFADLREFTRVAERKMPYDIVFLLNRYFEAVGGAVSSAGGVANQYTGDGVMALFGMKVAPEIACRQAIASASSMVSRIEELSQELAVELAGPLRLGIGIHTGSVVVGEMGYAGTRYLTAVGDTVNAASRLEALTKDFNCEMLISTEVLARAGLEAPGYPTRQLTLRNREAPLEVVLVQDTRRLANELLHQA